MTRARLSLTRCAVLALVPGLAPAQDTFPNRPVTIQVPPAYQDADEFRAWFDADAARLAEAVKRIGKVETK